MVDPVDLVIAVLVGAGLLNAWFGTYPWGVMNGMLLTTTALTSLLTFTVLPGTGLFWLGLLVSLAGTVGTIGTGILSRTVEQEKTQQPETV